MAKSKGGKQPQQAQEGDKVRLWYKGIEYTGVVTRIRYRESRKAKRFLALRGIVDPYGLGMRVGHVAVPGFGIIHTSSISTLRVLGRATDKEWDEATALEGGIKQARRKREWERKEAGQEKASEGGLYDLKPGAKILVEYRGGVKREETFLKLSASGRVGYRDIYGRERWANPQFVTKA